MGLEIAHKMAYLLAMGKGLNGLNITGQLQDLHDALLHYTAVQSHLKLQIVFRPVGFVLPDFLVHKLALNLTVTFEMLEDVCKFDSSLHVH